MTANSPSALAIAGRGLAWGLGGALLAPLLAFAIIIPFYVLDKRCGTPGDSGGCEMGFGMIVIAAPIPGAAIGCVAGLVSGVRRRARSAD